jgi:hypothetical protein
MRVDFSLVLIPIHVPTESGVPVTGLALAPFIYLKTVGNRPLIASRRMTL